MLLPGDRVVVGLSGGADSVCLLHILAKWQSSLRVELHAAHLNHQLRATESEADAIYVSELAGSLGIPVTVEERDVSGYCNERSCSIEEAARELRYDFLSSVAAGVGANRIAVGHTRDDHIETVLMHIIRGAGTGGLSGMAGVLSMAQVQRGGSSLGTAGACRLIRPLLDVTREETTDYCQRLQLNARIDSSNISPSFLRNRIRLHLLPLLRQYNPRLDSALLRLADIAREDSVFIEEQAAARWDEVVSLHDDCVRINRRQTAALPIALQRQLLRLAFTRLAGDARDIEIGHVEAARDLLGKPVGKMVFLPRGLVCWGDYHHLVMTDASSVASGGERLQLELSCPFAALEGEIPLEVPGETILPGLRVVATVIGGQAGCSIVRGMVRMEAEDSQRSSVAVFDLHKTGRQISVRHRRPGDRFQPLGMNGSKKIQDFMVDSRIPRLWRDYVPIVCTPEQIIWMVGWRIDERVKVSEETEEIVRLEFVWEE